MAASVVGAQLDACWADAPVSVIKTGMLVGADIVRALITRLDSWGSRSSLVVDPVLRSTSGRNLLDEDGRRQLVTELLPRAALVTPNLPEAEELTGRKAHDEDQMSYLADHFLAMGARAVLIKGGHLLERDPEATSVVDILRTMDGEEFRLRRSRLTPAGSRGTGCTLAAAVAAGLAEGLTLRTAVENATSFVHRALEESTLLAPVGALFHAALRV
jgi:hydroxymethylpyrimidine/phosphomethylpyrimidine kinase